MNRNLDGSPLTDDELLSLTPDRAVAEVKIGGHGGNMRRSILLDLTRQARYDLFLKGKLSLQTRTKST